MPEETLYQKLKAVMEPNQMSNHYSDLYVLVNDKSKAVIQAQRPKPHYQTFISNIDHKLWYDIPFAYDPYWEKKGVSPSVAASVGQVAGDTQAILKPLRKQPKRPRLTR